MNSLKSSQAVRSCMMTVAFLPLTLPVFAQNQSPLLPIIFEPVEDGQVVNGQDVHMETEPMSDPDGHDHRCSDWEVWTVEPEELVWQATCANADLAVHIHLADGQFLGSHFDMSVLMFDTEYRLRVRHSDNGSDDENRWSPWAERFFVTGPATQIFPLELVDIVSAPDPIWVDDTGNGIELPIVESGVQPSLRVVAPTEEHERHGGEEFLSLVAQEGAGNLIEHFPALRNHGAMRIEIHSGDLQSDLVLPASQLTMVSSEPRVLDVYMPGLRIEPGESAVFWVSSSGATYIADPEEHHPTFSNLARGVTVPWEATDPSFRVEIVATGFQLPVNIAFVPNPGDGAKDPYYYVTELYGAIKVVTRDGSIFDYATDLLNFNPTGNFPGSGEKGVAGLAVDPLSGDVYTSLVYAPTEDPGFPHYARVLRLSSSDGGITADSQQVILDMTGQHVGASHQVSNLTIGPDGYLYTHMGDAGFPELAQSMDTWVGKVLRTDLDGNPAPSNPFYDANDGITQRDYIYTWGLRNPFGGAWREADGHHYFVENGPSVDRFGRSIPGRNYTWQGSDANMVNFAIYNWNPAAAPVSIAFVQPGTFGGSNFPDDYQDLAYVTESGPTWATGPVTYSKNISMFRLTEDAELEGNREIFLRYVGEGKATASGIAAGPDGLYFSDLYKDQNYTSPIDVGANVLRIRHVGSADFEATHHYGPVGMETQFLDRSTVANVTGWSWDFGDGNSSTLRHPRHVYDEPGVYDVRLTVSGDGGLSVLEKDDFVIVGEGPGILASYYDDSELGTHVVDRLDSNIDFDWWINAPDNRLNPESFSARWRGSIVTERSGTEAMRVYTDDGSRLWIDSHQIFENWDSVAYRDFDIELTAGARIPFLMEYREHGGAASATVRWQQGTGVYAPVPRSAFYPPETELAIHAVEVPTQYELGEPVVYTLRVQQITTGTVTQPIVTVMVPPGTSVDAVHVGDAGSVVLKDGVLFWEGFNLTPGAPLDMTVQLVPEEDKQLNLVLDASIRALEYDDDLGNNHLRVMTPKVGIDSELYLIY